MSRVAVIVVSWNVREQLRACLASAVAAQAQEIIVIDNNSADGSADMVAKDFPQVRLLRQESNLGFARAVNIGMAMASADLLLLLNPDAVVRPDSLTKAEDF